MVELLTPEYWNNVKQFFPPKVFLQNKRLNVSLIIKLFRRISRIL